MKASEIFTDKEYKRFKKICVMFNSDQAMYDNIKYQLPVNKWKEEQKQIIGYTLIGKKGQENE